MSPLLLLGERRDRFWESALLLSISTDPFEPALEMAWFVELCTESDAIATGWSVVGADEGSRVE